MNPGRDGARGARLVPVASAAALVVAVGGAMFTLDRLAPAAPSPTAATAPSESPAQLYARTALDLVSTRALGVDPDTWPQIRRSALDAVAGAQTPAQTHDALEAAVFVATGGLGRLARPDDLRSSAHAPPPATATLRDGIGILSLPAVDEVRADAASARATAIARTVRQARSGVSCGWVIDLRGTGADADYGAIAGLSGFLPEGQLYSTEGRGGDGHLVTLAMATTFVGSRPVASASGLTPRIEQPVAVLQDEQTAGSSEALVLALRRGPDVRTFGTSTAGLPTNETFRLSDGALLQLPTTRVVDFDGQIHTDGLEPDVPAEPNAALATATAWLQDACPH
jgi:hypothetical protein